MTRIVRLSIAALVAFALNGCGPTHSADDGHDHDAAAHDQDDHGAHDDHDGGDEHAGHDHADEERIVRLTAAELEEFGIAIAVAGPHPIDITARLPGEVRMNPDAVAHVVARAAGIAREVHKTVGDAVAVGDTLAVLESPGLADAKAEYLSRAREQELAHTDLARAEIVHANTRRLLEFLSETPNLDALREFADLDLGANRNSLVSAYAALVATEASYAREKSLFDKQIGSEAEYLEAESAYKQAQAAFLSVRDDLAFTNERTIDQRRREAKVA